MLGAETIVTKFDRKKLGNEQRLLKLYQVILTTSNVNLRKRKEKEIVSEYFVPDSLIII